MAYTRLVICRLCLRERELIEAHIIPRCFFTQLKSIRGPMRRVTKEEPYPKRLPTGEYDTAILCAECDNLFSPWEDYTANLLMRNLSSYSIRNSLLTIPEYDYASVKL